MNYVYAGISQGSSEPVICACTSWPTTRYYHGGVQAQSLATGNNAKIMNIRLTCGEINTNGLMRKGILINGHRRREDRVLGRNFYAFSSQKPLPQSSNLGFLCRVVFLLSINVLTNQIKCLVMSDLELIDITQIPTL